MGKTIDSFFSPSTDARDLLSVLHLQLPSLTLQKQTKPQLGLAPTNFIETLSLSAIELEEDKTHSHRYLQ